MSNVPVYESEAVMAAFKDLSLEDQQKHFFKVAKEALSAWGYPANSELKLLNITENATFSVNHPEKEKIVMRVHRLDYAEKDSIETELAWINFIRSHNKISTVIPRAALDGSYIKTIETPELNEKRHVVCFEFAEGKAPIDSQDDNGEIGKITALFDKVPKGISLPLFKFASKISDYFGRRAYQKSKLKGKSRLTQDDVAIYQQMGRIAAYIHTFSRQWTKPANYKRIEWTWETAFAKGWNNYYGLHYSDCSILKAKDIAAIDTCVDLIKVRTEAYGKGPDRFGMIHSDLRTSNLLIKGDKITVLDFDDCGEGWFMYDLACIMGLMEHRPDLEELIQHIVKGYREIAPLSAEDEQEIMTFVMMRRIGLLEALMYHLHNTHAGSGESAELSPEILAFYAKGTAILSRQYVQKYASLPLPAKTKNSTSDEPSAQIKISKGVYA